ncbi:MAG: ABC transporter permease [Candidatus Eisenbacteria bacterium]|nr:ABC transporter permease [Candidatus Eisenbacteria bacterium]
MRAGGGWTAALRAARGRWEGIRRSRYLLRSLVIRDLKVKYQRSSLGFLWTLLNPLLVVVILTAVFRTVVRIRIEGYWAFLLSGYFVWNTVQHTLLSGSYTLQEHSSLARSVAFPREVLLFGAALSRLVEFAAEILLVLVVIVAAHHHGFPPGLLFLPLLILFQFLIAAGLMMPVAVLSTRFTDVQHALPILMTALFYLSPVFYPASMVPDPYRAFYFLNPLAGILTLYQQTLYEGRIPSPALLGVVAASSIVVFLAGYAVFHRSEEACNELL